jgi:hypothetical protein
VNLYFLLYFTVSKTINGLEIELNGLMGLPAAAESVEKSEIIIHHSDLSAKANPSKTSEDKVVSTSLMMNSGIFIRESQSILKESYCRDDKTEKSNETLATYDKIGNIQNEDTNIIHPDSAKKAKTSEPKQTISVAGLEEENIILSDVCVGHSSESGDKVDLGDNVLPVTQSDFVTTPIDLESSKYNFQHEESTSKSMNSRSFETFSSESITPHEIDFSNVLQSQEDPKKCSLSNSAVTQKALEPPSIINIQESSFNKLEKLPEISLKNSSTAKSEKFSNIVNSVPNLTKVDNTPILTTSTTTSLKVIITKQLISEPKTDIKPQKVKTSPMKSVEKSKKVSTKTTNSTTNQTETPKLEKSKSEITEETGVSSLITRPTTLHTMNIQESVKKNSHNSRLTDKASSVIAPAAEGESWYNNVHETSPPPARNRRHKLRSLLKLEDHPFYSSISIENSLSKFHPKIEKLTAKTDAFVNQIESPEAVSVYTVHFNDNVQTFEYDDQDSQRLSSVEEHPIIPTNTLEVKKINDLSIVSVSLIEKEVPIDSALDLSSSLKKDTAKDEYERATERALISIHQPSEAWGPPNKTQDNNKLSLKSDEILGKSNESLNIESFLLSSSDEEDELKDDIPVINIDQFLKDNDESDREMEHKYQQAADSLFAMSNETNIETVIPTSIIHEPEQSVTISRPKSAKARKMISPHNIQRPVWDDVYDSSNFADSETDDWADLDSDIEDATSRPIHPVDSNNKAKLLRAPVLPRKKIRQHLTIHEISHSSKNVQKEKPQRPKKADSNNKIFSKSELSTQSQSKESLKTDDKRSKSSPSSRTSLPEVKATVKPMSSPKRMSTPLMSWPLPENDDVDTSEDSDGGSGAQVELVSTVWRGVKSSESLYQPVFPNDLKPKMSNSSPSLKTSNSSLEELRK